MNQFDNRMVLFLCCASHQDDVKEPPKQNADQIHNPQAADFDSRVWSSSYFVVASWTHLV